MKDHLPEIALAHHNTAFNSAMKCTLFEAMYGLRAKTITEAGASPRLHITAEEGTGLTGLQEPDYNKWKSTISQSLQACRTISGRRSATIVSEQAHEYAKPEPIR